MRLIKFSNNAVSRIVAPITNASTTISMTPGDGAKFPDLAAAGSFFMATLIKADGTTEVVKVTARVSDTLTVVRAAEAVAGVTAAYAFNVNDRIEQRLTAGALGNELDRLDAAAVTGAINTNVDYTVTNADVTMLIRVDSTAGTRTITLPPISSLSDDFDITVAKVTGDANVVNVVRSASDTINGMVVYTLNNQWQSGWFVADRSTGSWTAINSGSGGSSITTDSFTVTTPTDAFTLSGNPGTKNNTAVYINGTYQQKATYAVVGNALTVGAVLPSGATVECVWAQPVSMGVPSDGAVSTQKLVDSAVTDVKLATGAVTDVKVASGAGIQSTKLSYTAPYTGSTPIPVSSRFAASVSVVDFGAVGDGIADDTIPFQNAFSAAALAGRGTVIGAFGKNFLISSKISITGSNIRFDGQECKITCGITNGDPLFEIATSGVVFSAFENFSAQGSSSCGHGIAAIGAGGIVQVVRVENVRFDSFSGATAKSNTGASMAAYGVYAYGVYTLRISEGYVQNSAGGIYCDSAQKIKVTGWNGDNLTDYGIYASACLAVNISGQNTLTGAGGAAKSGIYVNGCESVTVDGNRIKGGSGTYAFLTGDTLTRRLTISNNGFEVYTPSCIGITTSVESFSVRDNMLKFIGGAGPFTDGILVVDKTGGGLLSFSGEITGNDIMVGGADTLTNGVNINVTINAARAMRVGNNTIGGGGVSSVVTNGIKLAGNGVSNWVHNNAFAMSGGSVTNGVVVGSGQISANIDGNLANGTVTTMLSDSGTRTRVYESGTFTATLTGCTTSPTNTFVYERNGRTVTLKMLSTSGTSNGTGCTFTGLPASIQPATLQVQHATFFDNGLDVIGVAQVTNSGTVTFGKGTLGGAFTSTGVKGVRACTINYTL